MYNFVYIAANFLSNRNNCFRMVKNLNDKTCVLMNNWSNSVERV